MKKLLFIFIMSASLAANAKTTDSVIIVHSQGQTIKLSKDDVNYIFSKTGNIDTRALLRSHPQTIRNNDIADLILAIMKSKKQRNSGY